MITVSLCSNKRYVIMEEKILKILQENPTLSNREIGKIVGLSRGTI